MGRKNTDPSHQQLYNVVLDFGEGHYALKDHMTRILNILVFANFQTS